MVLIGILDIDYCYALCIKIGVEYPEAFHLREKYEYAEIARAELDDLTVSFAVRTLIRDYAK